MSEKYKVIYSADNNLYTEGSPIIVRDFSLFRDIKGGSMLGRIQLINISDKTIKRIKASVITTTERAEATADGLCIVRDSDTSVHIPLNGFDHKTAIFAIDEIVFTDGTSYSADEKTQWQTLSFPETLEQYLSDEDLVREFRSHFEEAQYYPKEEKDLWFCICGELNRMGEAACHSCNRALASLKKYGVVELKNAVAKQKRLDAVNKDKFDEAYKQIEGGRKSKRGRAMLYIIIAAAIATVIALLIASDSNHFTSVTPGVYY